MFIVNCQKRVKLTFVKKGLNSLVMNWIEVDDAEGVMTLIILILEIEFQKNTHELWRT